MQSISIFRRTAFGTTLLVLMTLQLVNISINVADSYPVAEDLSVNEIESCVELVLEVFLGNENAIHETQDHDHSTHRAASFVHFFPGSTPSIVISNKFSVVAASYQSFYLPSFKSLSHPIISPPPRV